MGIKIKLHLVCNECGKESILTAGKWHEPDGKRAEKEGWRIFGLIPWRPSCTCLCSECKDKRPALKGIKQKISFFWWGSC